MIVGGRGQYLFDEKGTRYLDVRLPCHAEEQLARGARTPSALHSGRRRRGTREVSVLKIGLGRKRG